MNSKRPIQVGISSSLIDLKAELLKKQAELKSSRAKQNLQRGVPKSIKKSEILLQAKNNVNATKNKGIETRSEKDLEEIRQVEKTIEKSKSILEEKAKLYEKMTSEALDHDELEHPVLSRALVNFTQKAIDEIKETQSKPLAVQPTCINFEEVEEEEGGGDTYNYEDDEEEWTEFTDGLGRTRRCLRSDLPSYLARDDEMARPSNPGGVSISSTAEQRLIEMKRQKWEQDSEAVAAKDKIHYQDVLYDEVRNHGVGFYGFSKDEEVRARQLKELKKTSEETDATVKKVLKERSEKKSALQERLKKVRAKKRAKLGLPPQQDESEEEEEEPEIKEKEEEEGPSSSKRLDVEEEKVMRAWDFGKPGVFGPQPETFDELDAKWLKDRRADRQCEFAPPSLYKK